MKIMYHITNNWTDSQIEFFKKEGHNLKSGYSSYQIEDSEYNRLNNFLSANNIIGLRYPLFTKKELKDSSLSAKSGSHVHGYPMPDSNGKYLENTYNLSDYCEECGVGKIQKNGFRLKNVPKSGKKRMFSVGWVFDELFVDIELYEAVFKPLGIKYRPVIKFNQEKPFSNTVQLIIDETEEDLNIENNPIESCNACGRYKYQPMPQGFYPKYKNEIAPIFKSREWFGTGAEARKRIFLNKELREKLIDMKIEKPIWYIPTE